MEEKENTSIYVKLNEFERNLAIKDYEKVIEVVRSLYGREFELVSRLPQVANHSEEVIAYNKKTEGLRDIAKGREVLRSVEPIPLHKVEFLWTIGLTADAYIAFVDLTAIGSIHRVVSNPFAVFRSFLNEASSRAIVIHTHPTSVKVEPSEADLNFTKLLIYSSNRLGITLEDHIIIGRYGEYSFFQNDTLIELKLELDDELKDKNELSRATAEAKKEAQKAIEVAQKAVEITEEKANKVKEQEVKIAGLESEKVEKNKQLEYALNENKELKDKLALFEERLNRLEE
jgi:hypothetical protein